MATETEPVPEHELRPEPEPGPKSEPDENGEPLAPRRRTDRRSIRSLGPRARWSVLLCLGIAALLPLLAAANALRLGWQPTGDVAIIGVRSLDAWTGDAPLVGQPSTSSGITGTSTFHPGPIENWWAGPWIRLLGVRVGLLLSAAAINGAALSATLWMVFRNGGRWLLALTAAFLALLVRSLGAPSLYDPFNSELATYPLLAVVIGTWAVVSRDLRVLPVLAVAFTVAAQLHVATAALAVPLFVIAVVFVAASIRRRPRLWHQHRLALFATAGILAVGWLPPVAQELSRGPSNLGAILRASTEPHDTIGVSLTMERFASALVPRPLFTVRTGRYGFLVSPGAATILAAALVCGGAVSLALLVRRRAGAGSARRLAQILIVTIVAGLVSNRSLPPLTTLRADATRWLWVTSLLVWLTLVWSALRLAGVDARRRFGSAPFIVAAVVSVALVGSTVAADALATQRDGAFMPATGAASADILRAVPRGTYLLRYDGTAAFWIVGPGVALRLEAAGRHVVPIESFDPSLGPPQALDRQSIDGTLRVVTGPSAAPEPDETEVSRQPAGPSAPDEDTVTVFLAR